MYGVWITISRKPKRGKRRQGYEVTRLECSKETGEQRYEQFYESYDDAKHRAVWWSHRYNDAEINEYGIEWSLTPLLTYRASTLKKDDPILIKVLAGKDPPCP